MRQQHQQREPDEDSTLEYLSRLISIRLFLESRNANAPQFHRTAEINALRWALESLLDLAGLDDLLPEAQRLAEQRQARRP